uniref:Monocarboxylate transporter 9-like n=1 Tax=Saccoglossus kowalevskii TaxID=10224 RepID=A0ABM0M150_SACKO|nr:PREDICTED: monocarboxylate transporter 9-like [Saccoglossus kowalevskii]
MKLVYKEDGGWHGWIVVLGSFITNALNFGCQVGMGVFMVEFMKYFDEGAGKTSAIQALQAGVMLIPSPIISSLNNRFGTRPLVVTGGIVSSVGLALCSFANSVYVLYLTYGIIVGIGYGCAYGPCIVIVGQYFHKRHALANGIMCSGMAVGMLAYPPIARSLIDTYGWRGAFIIMSAINLNIAVSGLVMRPPSQQHRVIALTNAPRSYEDIASSTGANTLDKYETDEFTPQDFIEPTMNKTTGDTETLGSASYVPVDSFLA